MIRTLFNIAIRCVRWLTYLGVTLLIVLAVGVGIIRLFYLSDPKYRDQFEVFAEQALGFEVDIEDIDIRWGWRGPALWLEDVRMSSIENAELTMAAAEIGISMTHWLATRQWQVSRLRLHQPATQLLLKSDRSLWWSDQLLLDPNVESDKTWSLNDVYAKSGQSIRISIRDGAISLVNEIGEAPVTYFIDIQRAVFEHGDQKNTFMAQLAIPERFGQRLELSGDIEQNDGMSAWRLELLGSKIQIANWQSLFEELGVKSPVATSGIANVALNMTGFDSLWHSMSLGFKGESLAINKTTSLTSNSWQAEDVKFGAAIYRVENRTQLEVSDLMVSRESQTWPETSTFSLSYVEPNKVGAKLPVHQMTMQTNFARLQDLVPLLTVLPFELPNFLNELSMQGDIRDLDLTMLYSSEALQALEGRVAFSNLGQEGLPDWPSLKSLTGSWEGSAQKGQLTLNSEQVVAASVPGFDGELQLTNLNGVVQYQNDEEYWEVESEAIQLANEFFTQDMAFRLYQNRAASDASNNKFPTDLYIDLSSNVQLHRLELLQTHLPTQWMKPRLVDWFDGAFTRGQAIGHVRFSGYLKDNVFSDDQRLQANFDVSDADIRYAYRWPKAEGVSCQFVMEGPTLRATEIKGEVLGLAIQNTQTDILDVRKPVLNVDASLLGDVANVKRLVTESPLDDRTGGHIRPFAMTGSGDLDIDLVIPLNNIKQMETFAKLKLKNSRFALPKTPILLDQVQGQLLYKDGVWGSSQVTGRLFERPFDVSLFPVDDSTRSEFSPRASVHSVLALEGRLNENNLAILQPALPDVMNGESNWRVLVSIPQLSDPNAIFEMIMRSDLIGTTTNLPYPLFKQADVAEPWRMQLQFLGNDTIVGEVSWAERLQGQLEWLKEDTQWAVARSVLSLGQTVEPLRPFPGLVVTGETDRLNLQEWMPYVMGGEEGIGDVLGALQSVDIRAGQATFFGAMLQDLRMQVDRGAQDWLVNLDSDAIAGAIFLPFEVTLAKPINAKLDRLYWRTEVEETEMALDFSPTVFPALRLEVDDFRFKDIKAGQLFAKVNPILHGVKLVPFSTVSPALEMQGEIVWIKDPELGHQSDLNLEIRSTRAADALKDLGFEPVIDASRANVRLDLHWDDSIKMKNIESLDGSITLDVHGGQLYAFEPGAGKILGLLSIASLPRRLALDFRDILDKGLGFDRLEGDFTIEDGIATTQNLLMEGSVGQFVMIGTSDLAKREYNQTAVVKANLGSALPVAGVVAGGPLVGGALFIFSEIFKSPLQDLSATTYRITGPFDEPIIQKIATQ